jgi:excisionase family DNA binding protein
MATKPNKDAFKRDKLTLTPRESVRITGFGVNHTYALLKSGEMPSIRVGKKFYIPKAALQKWLENCGGEKTA